MLFSYMCRITSVQWGRGSYPSWMILTLITALCGMVLLLIFVRGRSSWNGQDPTADVHLSVLVSTPTYLVLISIPVCLYIAYMPDFDCISLAVVGGAASWSSGLLGSLPGVVFTFLRMYTQVQNQNSNHIKGCISISASINLLLTEGDGRHSPTKACSMRKPLSMHSRYRVIIVPCSLHRNERPESDETLSTSSCRVYISLRSD